MEFDNQNSGRAGTEARDRTSMYEDFEFDQYLADKSNKSIKIIKPVSMRTHLRDVEIAVEAENAYSEFVENRRKYSNY